MKDIRQVLQQKQLELDRLQRQVECLKTATPLLLEPQDYEQVDVQQLIVPEEQKRNMWP